MIDPRIPIRIARPSRNLAKAERFYTEGLGLQVLYRKSAGPEESQDLLMLGWPEAGWHLELVYEPDAPIVPTPSVEDLLVLYLNGPVPDELIENLVHAGGQRVVAHNPYWHRWGVTFADPDGYRLVLCSRGWQPA